MSETEIILRSIDSKLGVLVESKFEDITPLLKEIMKQLKKMHKDLQIIRDEMIASEDINKRVSEALSKDKYFPQVP